MSKLVRRRGGILHVWKYMVARTYERKLEVTRYRGHLSLHVGYYLIVRVD